MAMKQEQISGFSAPDGVSIDDDMPTLLPFPSIRSSESGVDEDLEYAQHEGIPTSPTTNTVQSQCEIGFGDEVSEEAQLDIVKSTVFGVASNLMEVVVGMRKTQMQDDELSTNTSSILWNTSALDISVDACINKAESQDSSDSVSIPPEIEMLHMETDRLLESIRIGDPLDGFLEFPNKNREGVEDTQNQKQKYNYDQLERKDPLSRNREGDDNLLNRKQYNLDQSEDKDDMMSISSYFTDDDGMRGEIQNLGLAVSNLRHDLENFSGPLGYGDCESSSGMSEASMLGARQCSLREIWSHAFEEIALSIKTLRRLRSEGAGNNASEEDLDGTSRVRGMFHDWSSTILWSAAIILIGSYFRASLFTENGFNELEGSEMLDNLEWMFSKED
mmetsp:Transcript_25007/g.29465  ORF Transcript_25007/g.29465 Transcript_25007/m.29465 type:complete len:389 (+) Transcript_25007:101-1267(+)|eukprot:CAMPEP_0198250964 /NCGR_PEP_ID=MMETSP1447-20131203/1953_1 /TAXON_ID=420782 /ORGANISM="Chaetoceros dichaeta, Strain CCMP1751" /LENGTH=388 /DNA_ID=CAMNT_0043935887 /DNA_START=46 /DNA_END=1212 /DNA_ORIENTATION=+